MQNSGRNRLRVCRMLGFILSMMIPVVLHGDDVNRSSPSFNPPEINVPEGFTVELVAGPSLVNHPTFATFDERGRLFVSENAGVNLSAQELEEKLPNSIRMLEDTNNDGIFDKSTVFADKMTFPMGGAWHQGSLYVASPPYIWKLQDTDNDGIADKKDVLVSKFGYTGNAADIHGCISGPDGRLYWCDGFHGHEFKDASGNIISQRKGSYIFSCRSDGSDVRIHCGGGMDNPVEVDFTEEGDILGTVNIMYTRPRVDCLVHWLYGGVYPHREQIFSEVKVTGDFLGPVHRFGHVAVSGTMRYRSEALNQQWKNTMFATFFNSGKVVRINLEKEGSTYKASQWEFLSSTSREFHPTDIVEDADGSLLVVDTGGWFYRGCPTSQFAKPDILGGIYRIRQKSLKPHDDPRGLKIEWAKMVEHDLVSLLNDTRFTVRDKAIEEAARRGKMIIPALKKGFQQGDSLTKTGIIWTLTRMAGDHNTEAHGLISSALKDTDEKVRQTACRSLATYPEQGTTSLLIPLLNDETPAVRREAATALGRLRDPMTVPSLLNSLAQQIDRAEEHSLLYALIEINNPEATRKGFDSSNPRIQRAAMFALDQMNEGKLNPDEVIKLSQSKDIQLKIACAEIFIRHKDWKQHAVTLLQQLLTHEEILKQNTDLIRRVISQSLSDDVFNLLIGKILSDNSENPFVHDAILKAFTDTQGLKMHESWKNPLMKKLDDSVENLKLSTPENQRYFQLQLEQIINAVQSIKTDFFKEKLKAIGNMPSLPALLRIQALESATGQRGKLTDTSLELLLGLIENSPRESLQAAQRIGEANLTKPQLLNLAAKLENVGPSQLREMILPFERSQDKEVAQFFLNSLKNARSLTSLAPAQFSDIIKSYPKEMLPLANQLLEQIKNEEQEKLVRLDKLLSHIEHGQVENGRKLFFSEKAKCSTCHRAGQEGGKTGPDLSNIGANRTPRDLLESVVFPSSTIVRDYEPYSLITSDGRILSGLISRETTDTIFIQQQTGDPLPVNRKDIAEITPSSTSIMPGGLEKTLTEQELADLIKFLMNLKSPTESKTK